VASKGHENVRNFEIANLSPSAYIKMSEQTTQLKKRVILFISGFFLCMLLSMIFLTYFLQDVVRSSMKYEFKKENEFEEEWIDESREDAKQEEEY
jgi:hypothetical protein